MIKHLKFWIASGVIVIGTLILLYPVTQHTVYFGDYPAHIQFAIQMQNGSIPVLTHPLFHFALILTQAIAHISPENAALVVVLIAQCALAPLIFGILSDHRPQHTAALLMRVGLTFVLMLVSAITFFTWEQHNFYFGYIVPHVYHNPTTLVLKPLALLSFIYAIGIFIEMQHFKSTQAWMISAILVVASALAKPNYIIVILPTIGLFGLNRLMIRGTLHWKLAVLGFILPAGLILLLQLTLLPNAGSGTDKIAVMPLAFIYFRGGFDYWLLKLIMSLAFPACVYLLHWQVARRQASLNLAWLAMGIALGYYYFVVETNRIDAGNFTWGAQVMILTLFVFSTKFLIEQLEHHTNNRITLREVFCIGVLLLHFGCGVIWYIINLNPANVKSFF